MTYLLVRYTLNPNGRNLISKAQLWYLAIMSLKVDRKCFCQVKLGYNYSLINQRVPRNSCACSIFENELIGRQHACSDCTRMDGHCLESTSFKKRRQTLSLLELFRTFIRNQFKINLMTLHYFLNIKIKLTMSFVFEANHLFQQHDL